MLIYVFKAGLGKMIKYLKIFIWTLLNPSTAFYVIVFNMTSTRHYSTLRLYLRDVENVGPRVEIKYQTSTKI